MNRLRELRLARGLTTIELGKLIKLDSSMITHIEKGNKTFSIDSLYRACEYFGVSSDYLLGKTPEDMLKDFVDSFSNSFGDIRLDSSGEPVKGYQSEVSSIMRIRIEILRLINASKDEAALSAAYSFLRFFTDTASDFADTPESEAALSMRVSKARAIMDALPHLSDTSLDVVLETTKLQMRKTED